MARSARLTESALSELTQPLLDGEEIDDGTFVEPPKKTTFLQVGAAMYAFLVLGLYAGTIGAIIPYLQSYYELNDLQVSFTFLSGPLGYVLAAQFNHLVHLNLGQRGNAAIGPAFQLLSASITSTHPPFIGVLMSVAFGGIGLGLIDGTWSAWGGIVERANLVSGLLHGAFSVGAMLAPLCITLLLSDGGRPWYSWFHVMVSYCKPRTCSFSLTIIRVWRLWLQGSYYLGLSVLKLRRNTVTNNVD
jgi:fucose permease